VEIRGTGRRRSHSPDLVIWPPMATPYTPITSALPATPGVPATPELPTAPEPPDVPVAVEVELTRKAKGELMANCRAWARCRYVEAVVYFAETREIEEKLLDAIEECRAEDKIVVNPLREILKPQPGFPLIDE
jgi:hypothetical protein